METILAAIISFMIGYILTKLLSDVKLNKLITKIETLTNAIDLLNVKMAERECSFVYLNNDLHILESKIIDIETRLRYLENNIT